MAEYIEKEALYEKAYWHGEHPDIDNPYADGVDAVDVQDIDSIPAADVAPVVHGRWIKRPDERICPFCNDSHAYFGGADWNYCHNCGARMDGEGNG